MKKIIVASKNPVKIQVARLGFEKMFPEEKFEVVDISVPSDVKDQPMTYEETLKGAINRAQNAQKEIPEADFWVGMEGGIEETNEKMETAAFIVVIDKNGKMESAYTTGIRLSPPVIKLIKEGYELGKADDIIFAKENSGKDLGVAGTLTDGLWMRTDYYLSAMYAALIPFKNHKYYYNES